MKHKYLTGILFSLFFLVSQVASVGNPKKECNVIKTDENGNKIALCACGKNVTVNESTPKVVDGDEVYYVCTTKCKNYFEEHAAEVKPDLKMKVKKAKAAAGTLGNVYKVDDSGKLFAVCACDKELVVDANTMHGDYKGETYYICNQKCMDYFDDHKAEMTKSAKANADKRRSESK